MWYRFDGRQLGYTGNNGTLDTSYTSSIASRTQAPGTGAFRGGQSYGGAYAEFDGQVTNVTSYAQGSSGGGGYTVRTGDTLAGIAAQLWGDGALWYKLAQANGLAGDAALQAGQTLNVPAGVQRAGHSAATFKPYDPAEALGDTSPTSPAPQAARAKKNKCGVFGQILLVVVAVAVAVASQGTFAAALGGSSILGGAAAGAAGSIVSQGLGVATGIQDKFSWGGVALAAIGGGVGGGLQGVNAFGTASGIAKVGSDIVRGALGSALTQGIGVATGLQSKFDWAGVAAAGLGAGIGGVVSRSLGASASSIVGRTATSTASALADAATRSLVEGTDFGDNILAALPSAIGQAIGGYAGDALSDEIANGATRRLLNGDQADQNAGTARIAKGVDAEISSVRRKYDRAVARGDTVKAEQLAVMLQTMTDPAIRERSIVGRAAMVKYGSHAGGHTVADTIGADNSVVPLISGTPEATPTNNSDEVVVTGQRLGGRIHAESSIGRVVVDTLDYGQSLSARYGAWANFAIAGIKTLATGGIAPLLSYTVDQGISAAIPHLPDRVLEPLATKLESVTDFIGGLGGGFLLQIDKEQVVPIDREGVVWGASTLLGIGVAALAGKAVMTYRASKAARAADAAAPEILELSKARFGHAFATHGQDATDFLTKRAAGSGMPQGQFLDDQAAARFILDNVAKTKSGPVSLPIPKGLPARVIMPDGSFGTPTTIRLVPGGKGVKTAYPEL